MGRNISPLQLLIGLLALSVAGLPSDDVQSSTSTSVSVSTVTRKVTSRFRHADVSSDGTAAVAGESPAPEPPEADRSFAQEIGDAAPKSLKIKKKILASNLKNISEKQNLPKWVVNATEGSDASGKPNASDSAEDDLLEDVFVRSENGTAEAADKKTRSEDPKRKENGGAVEGRSLEDRSSEENVNVNGKTKGPSTTSRPSTYEPYEGALPKVLSNNFLNNNEERRRTGRPSTTSSVKKSSSVSRGSASKNTIRFEGEVFGPTGQTDWVPIVPDNFTARPSQQFGTRLKPSEKLNETSESNPVAFPTTENVRPQKNVILEKEVDDGKTTSVQRNGGVEKESKILSNPEGWIPISQLRAHPLKFRGALRYKSPQSNSTVGEKFSNGTSSKTSGTGVESAATGVSRTPATSAGAVRSTEKPVTEISVVKVSSTTNHTGKFQNGGVIVPPENVKIEKVTKEQQEGTKTTTSATYAEEDVGKHNESEILNSLPKVMEGWSPEGGKNGALENETEVASTAADLETTLPDITSTTENIPELTATEVVEEISSQIGSENQPPPDTFPTTDESHAETKAEEWTTPTPEVDALPTTETPLQVQQQSTTRATEFGEEESLAKNITATPKTDANTTAEVPPKASVGVVTSTTSSSTPVEVENKTSSTERVAVMNATSTPVAAISNATTSTIATPSTTTTTPTPSTTTTTPTAVTVETTTPTTATLKTTTTTTTAKTTTSTTATTAGSTTASGPIKSEAPEQGIYYKNYIPTTINPHDEITEENVPAYLRLTVQATSWEELCRLKEDLRESIIKMLGGKNVSAESVHFLNLNERNCEEKIEETRADSLANRTFFLPVNMFLMDKDGNFDKNLSEAFLTLWGRKGLDFELPIRKVDFVTPIVNLTELTDSPLGGSVVAAIVISCVAGICVILLGILFVIMKRRQKRFNYGQRCTPVSLDAYSLDSVSIYNSVRRKGMRASKRSYGNAAFDDPEVPTHPMNFAGIANFGSDKDQLCEEFNVIAQVCPKAEELPAGAETKNRYANVIPLPETRVHLSVKDGDPLSDYINANYVRGLKGAEKLYIACQAPMESTIGDFWRMVWEQQCKVILMLTDLQENGIEKCADYLPPNEVTDNLRLFGDFQVTLKKRDVKEKYIISNLKLKNMDANLWREVTHLWYLGWPDQGVPSEANSLIAFLIEARSQSKIQNGATTSSPTVVHCSPGTGRTGTVIACDLCIREYEQSRMVDVPKCVFNLRRDRAGAVQTKDQYAFIYQVLNVYATKLSGGGIESI